MTVLGQLIVKSEWVSLLNSILPGGANWHKARKNNVNCLDICPWESNCKGNGPDNHLCSDQWYKAESTPIVLDVLYHILDYWNYYNQKDIKDIFEDSEKVIELRKFVVGLMNDNTFSVKEGGLAYRTHKYRERNSQAAKKLKEIALRNKSLICAGCRTNYFSIYGDLGIKIIECHHIVPISSVKHTGETKSSELKLLCANCHRLVHSKKAALSIKELKKVLKNNI